MTAPHYHTGKGAAVLGLSGLTDLVQLYGDETWVALEQDDRQLTVAELARGMCAAAGALSDDAAPVVVSTPDALLSCVAALGALAAGRRPLLVDHRFPLAAVQSLAARAHASTVIGRPVEGLVERTAGDLAAGPEITPVRARPEDPGLLLCTSGTDGAAKLVDRTRGADLYGAYGFVASRLGLVPGDRFWLPAPHAGSPFPGVIMAAFAARATVVFAPFEAATAAAFLIRARISSGYLGPTMLRLVAAAGGYADPGWQQLRVVLVGGEKVDGLTEDILLNRLPGRAVVSYGCTEVTRVAEATGTELRDRPGTVGRCLPFHQVRIVDPATGDEVPAGADGELLVRGASMYSGYVGSPPSPGWHRSGDIGRVDAEGYLYVTGRASSIVQIGANRVSTEEVAAAIRAHERIADTVVIALADPTWGDRLEAFVVREPGHDLTGTELLGWLRERLPAYKVPRAVHWLDTIPVDRSGKTSLRTLRELATARSQA